MVVSPESGTNSPTQDLQNSNSNRGHSAFFKDYTLVTEDPRKQGLIGSLGAHSLGTYSLGAYILRRPILGKVAQS